MRNWFWLSVVSGGKLRWPRWFMPLLLVIFLGLLIAGGIYAFIVFQAVSERNNTHHVRPHSSQ
jgi:hypothetical protein